MGRHALEGGEERDKRKRKVPEKGSRVTPGGRDILEEEGRYVVKEPGL